MIDIHDESVNASNDTAPLTRAMARFASLLVILSKESDKQTKKVIRLTNWLLALTWALLILTAYLSFDIFQKNRHINDEIKEKAAKAIQQPALPRQPED